jgi:hypothetical protein
VCASPEVSGSATGCNALAFAPGRPGSLRAQPPADENRMPSAAARTSRRCRPETARRLTAPLSSPGSSPQRSAHVTGRKSRFGLGNPVCPLGRHEHMGILRRNRQHASPSHAWLPGGTELHVVGMSYRPEAVELARLSLPADGAASAVLVPLPDNPHDPHAVAVAIGEQHVGWLSRHITPVMQPALNAFAAAHGGQLVACPARVTEGQLGTRILLYLDLAPLGVDPGAVAFVPDLDQVITNMLPRLDEAAPAMTGCDDESRQALAAAEAYRAAVDEDYDRSPDDWPLVERAFRDAAIRLETSHDPLVSDAWLGVARATRFQHGRRDFRLGAAVEAVHWDPGSAEAWAELIGIASAAPHVPTLLALFGRVPFDVQPAVLRQLITLSRGRDRLANMSPAEGARLRAELLALARSEGDEATVKRLLALP